MRPSFRAQAKKRRRDPVLLSAARWVAALLAALYFAWSLYVPTASGELGRAASAWLTGLLGASAYLLPPAAAYGLALYFRTEKASGYLTWGVGTVLTVGSAAMLFGAAGSAASRPEWGGVVGSGLAAWLGATFGPAAAWLAGLGGAAVGLQVLFDISWTKTLAVLARVLYDDWRGWRRAKRERCRAWSARHRARSAAPAPDLSRPRCARPEW
jgi:hypothetical protein